MESFLVGSLHNSSSITITGGNLWQSEHRANKISSIHYASSYAPKVSQNKRNTQEGHEILGFFKRDLNYYKYIKRGSTYQQCNKEYVVKAASGPSFESELHATHPKNMFHSVKNFLIAFYRFSSPYAIIARTLGTISASLLAVEKLSDLSPLFFTGVLKAMLPFIFMDIYIAGMNQLFDIEIDKINKPYLPLASGQLSFTSGVTIVASCLILSFWTGWTIGSWPLIWSLLLGFVLWTAYSANVPMLRWKRHPLLAILCILTSWAFILPISNFLHMQTFVFKRPSTFPRSLSFVIIFMSFYSVGITLLKDIPDIEGDKTFGINSFAARFGKKQVFWFCVSLFEMAFGIALLMGATSSSSLWNRIVTGSGHALLALILWYHAKSVDLRSNTAIASFYMLIWKLLFAEYFIMPLVR